MYYGVGEYTSVYNKIVRTASSPSSCQLVMMVSCLNIDALCAAKMLSLLFKKQLIQSQIVPVFGYGELQTHYAQLDDNINTVLLIGFGGFVDMESFLDIDVNEYLLDPENVEVNSDSLNIRKYKRDIYILDGHRPWNLDNLFGSELIHCLDDGTVEESLQSQKDAYYRLVQLEEERANDSEDNGASSSEDEEEREEDQELEQEYKGDTDTDEENEERPYFNRKRPNADNLEDRSRKGAIKHRRGQIRECEDILEDYYSRGTTVVNSISSQVYSLLSSIGETNIQHLWLTILGTTSLDVIYSSVYNRLFPLLEDEVKRLSPDTLNGAVKTPDTISLDIQPDYYLFLLRHTSLYDSFFYSNFVNAKLSLWNENGKKRLHKMFARMGIPLTTAQESWLYMDNSIKRELGMIFDRNLDRYGLQDIIRDGFVRTFGYNGTISASEFVEALTALLEVGRTVLQDPNGNISSVNSNFPNHDSNVDNDEIESQNENTDVQSKKKWISNFWYSWDALDSKKMDLLKQGLQHAQFLQKSVFNTGVTILEKRLIKHLRIYRLCVLQDGPDLVLYQNPLTLLRLGNWLIECCAESEDKQLLPMVLASLNEQTDTYLVAGLSPRYPRGLDTVNTKKPILNNFSMAFQQITTQTGAKVKIDNFESSIIEVSKDDLSPFLERLTLSGLV